MTRRSQKKGAQRRRRWSRALLVVPSVVLPILVHVALMATQSLPALAAAWVGPPPASPAAVTLSFVGDILLGGTVGDLIDTEGPLAPWQGVKDLLSASDLTCGNLECPVGTTGTAVSGKTWTFRADPKTLEGLKASGIDVVSLANNHALDYGQDCLLESIDLIKKAGLGVVGAGADEKSARTPFIFEKNGLKVGILSTAELVPYPSWAATKDSPGLAVDYYGWYPGIVSSIKELAGAVDVVVVMIHWGDERTTVPAERLASIALAMKEAGAHVIVGTHPHILEGIAFDGRALTAYSLGNFVFSTRPEIPALQAGAILNLTVSKGKVESVSIVPTQVVWGKTTVAGQADRDATFQTLSTLSRAFRADVSDSGEVAPLVFTDMDEHWARFTAWRLAARGSVQGYEDGSFRPENRVSMGEFGAMFVRLVASPEEVQAVQEPQGFALCGRDAWCYPYLKFLAGRGIISPTDPKWVCDKECSRLDGCTTMWKYANTLVAAAAPPAQGLDVQGLNAVTWAVGEGILKGYPDGTLRPSETASRAEMAEMLVRYLESRGK